MTSGDREAGHGLEKQKLEEDRWRFIWNTPYEKIRNIWADPSVSTLYFSISTLLGASSIYVFSYTNRIPRGLRDFIDPQFLSVLYIDFLVALAVSGAISRVAPPMAVLLLKSTRFILTWIVSRKALSHRCTAKKIARIAISRLIKNIRHNKFLVSIFFFAVSMSLILLDLKTGLVVLGRILFSSIFTFGALYATHFRVSQELFRSPRKVFPFPNNVPAQRKAEFLIKFLALVIVTSVFFWGDAKFDTGKNDIVAILLSDGSSLAGGVVATSRNGLLLFRMNGEGTEPSLEFLTFEGISRVSLGVSAMQPAY